MSGIIQMIKFYNSSSTTVNFPFVSEHQLYSITVKIKISGFWRVILKSILSDDGPFEQYFDEYYKLDCEDVIGDVKCRFGYRKAKRCSYGLTVDEVMSFSPPFYFI